MDSCFRRNEILELAVRTKMLSVRGVVPVNKPPLDQ